MTIDLHLHSTFSDGTESPAQIMASAHVAGVSTVAIVDHDTTDGWSAAAAARPAGVALVRGTELSTHVAVGSYRCSIHLLAYLFDPDDTAMAAELERLRTDRLDRGLAMVDRMVAAGLPVSREQVLDIAAGAPVGRPHLARALMTHGLVSSVADAFGSYLSARSPYYVPKSDTALVDALALVRGAGGVPVIAHARSRGAAAVTDEAFFARCVDAGLLGVEVDHPDHDEAARAELTDIAGRFGLVTTGSSDYHGANKTVTIGQETTSPDSLARLVDLSSGVTPVLAGE